MGSAASAVEFANPIGIQFLNKLAMESISSTTAADGSVLSTKPKLVMGAKFISLGDNVCSGEIVVRDREIFMRFDL